MTPSKNNSFGASDIERYRAGKMSVAERNALEKAALDDPFLADALEGYAYTSTPAEDLKQLQEKLQQKKQETRTIPLYSRAPQWMRAAAIILLVGGLGWLAYRVLTPTNGSIALGPEQSNKANASANKQPVDSSPVPAANSTATKELPRQSAPKDLDASEANGNIAAKNMRRNESSPKPQDLPGQQNGSVAFKTKKTEAFNADSMATAPSSVADATRDESRFAAPNVQANRTYRANDSGQSNVVARAMSQPPAEGVVMQKSAAKKAEAPVAELPVVVIDTLEPAEGLMQFVRYVSTHQRPIGVLSGKPVSGQVQLSFEVNEEGEPVNITVLKPLCDKCDEEAVRLLKEGPKWKPSGNKKGKLTIRF